MTRTENHKVLLIGWSIWFLAALFFLYEFFLRVFVSTISNSIMVELNLNAQQFAVIGAGYYLSYSIMQIPIGILVDRFGVRILLTIFVSFAAFGACLFAFAHGFTFAFISRVFMGLGSSAAYVSLLVIALNWFPKKHIGFMIGISGFLGAIGPVLAGGPLALLLNEFNNNWRLIVEGIGLVGFILAGAILLFVRTTPARKKGEIIYLDPSKESLTKRLSTLVKQTQAWFVILYSGFVYVSLPLLGAYWGTGYLQAKGFTRTQAASVSSLLWIGLAFGSLLSGKISDRLKRRKFLLSGCSIIGIIASSAILFWPEDILFLFGIFFFFLGFASGGQSVAFATISEKVPVKLQGTAFGMNNTCIMLFAGVIPPLVSHFIVKAAEKHREVVANYTVADFHEGLVFMPFFYFIALIISSVFIEETYNRHQLEIIKISK